MVGTGEHQPQGGLGMCGQGEGARYFWGWEGLQHYGVGLEYACHDLPCPVCLQFWVAPTSARYFSLKLSYHISPCPTQLLSSFLPAQTQVQN